MRAIPSLLSFQYSLPQLPLPTIARWRRIRRERQRLLELSDHMLADIGLTRAEARAEAARPFWDPPPRP